MLPAALALLTSGERDEARRLIEAQGLSFEEGCDELVGIYQDGRLVATAARAGYVLKMFAIDEDCQGGDALGQLTTTLVDSGRRAGHEALFVYTRPQHAASFEACGFRLLVACGEVALLEHGGGLAAYLDGYRHFREALSGRDAVKGDEAGAVVVNANPFTRGHQHLVETAAARVKRLYLFVVRENRSVFPFDVRYKLVRDGVAHLRNVVLLDTSRYAVSAGTFPSYFLKPGARERAGDASARRPCQAEGSAQAHATHIERLQMEVDARLFGAHIAPAFGIGRRFVGEEPYCETTAAYNEILGRILPEYGVALDVMPRIGDGTGFISATRVRAALRAGDLQTVARQVPNTTLAFLRSHEGAAIVRRIRN